MTVHGAWITRGMVPNGLFRSVSVFVFFVAVVFSCVFNVAGDNAERCRTEQDCHFGAIGNQALNLSEPISTSDPVALALARFSVVPHGCADHFERFVEARSKLPQSMLTKAGTSESLCDSKRIFSKRDIAVASFVAITNSVIFIIISCTIDQNTHE